MEKLKFNTDSQTGVRRINEIEKLPVKELTDDEVVKLFFKRFQAESLLFYYQDKKGERWLFGRTRTTQKVIPAYRSLLTWIRGIGYNLFDKHDIRSIDVDDE